LNLPLNQQSIPSESGADTSQARQAQTQRNCGSPGIRNVTLRPFASETGSDCTVCSVGRGRCNKDVHRRIKAIVVKGEDVSSRSPGTARVSQVERYGVRRVRKAVKTP